MTTSEELQNRIHSPRPLPVLEAAWLDRFNQLRTHMSVARGPDKLAAPFLSVPLPGYQAGNPETILMVGKATSGKNTIGSAEVQDWYDLDAVKKRTVAVIEEQLAKEYTSAFLNLANRLSLMGLKYAHGKLNPFDNLIWSNLAKIGTETGNPGGSLSDSEECLIAETLAAEVAAYRPRLIYFATGWYRFGLVRKILQELCGEDGKEQMYSPKRLWCHTRTSSGSAYLWTMHPERKSAAEINNWVDIADTLMRT